MYKPMIQLIVTLFIILSMAIITSCNQPRLSKENLAIELSLFLENEQAELALELLSQYSDQYSNDPEILKLAGLSHLQLNDPASADPFFEQAFIINPTDDELLLLSFQTKKEAGLDFSGLLIQVAKKYPNRLQSAEWLALSDIFAQEQKFEEAINTQFLALGTNQLTSETPIDSAFKIAQYYRQLNQPNRAESWLEYVSQSNSIDAFSAFLDLIEIYGSNENWNALQSTVNQFKARFPGALETSKYAKIESLIPQIDLGKETKLSPSVAVSKSSINDIDNLEALANKIAESITEIDLQEESSPIEYNPDILIQPADPDTDLSFSGELDGFSEVSFAETFTPLSPSEIEIMTIKANNALLENDLETAIQLFKTILKSDPSRHSIWNRLSQSQQSNNNLQAASEAAIEAIKLSPDTINYTINYLQIAGKTKTRSQVLFDLISASERFPNSPEITLSLARAYDRIRNRFKAIELYKKFITLAPNHPLRPEAQSAIARLTN